MYRKVSDFTRVWDEEIEMTIHLFQEIKFDKKGEKFNENVRSLERLVWHICQSITEMGHRGGLFAEDVLEQKTCPATIEEVIETYKTYANLFRKHLLATWKDKHLTETLPMYGEEWAKGRILSVLLSHQTHHRGQLTVVMRILGLPVVGLYGPAKEEWGQYGMATME